MTNITNNNAAFGKAINEVMSSKEAADSGAFAIISKHADDIRSLATAIETADKDTSVRSIVLGSYFNTDAGAAAKAKYDKLVALKQNISAMQKTEKETLAKRFKAVDQFMTITLDVFNTLQTLARDGFTITYRTVANTGRVVCRIEGPQDDEAASFSVAQVRKLSGLDLSAARSFAHLQELATSGRKGAANKDKGSNQSIAPGKVAEVATALDTAIAKVDHMGKDNGMTKASREALLRMYARLDDLLSDDEKALAHRLFSADDDGGMAEAELAGAA